ncbi:MAG: hypothetical protein HYV07_08415 [Deltaproteobacteria bacterium]|nr:hypothetical protein [Deltaproteobacteria bacterium]
MGSVSRDAEVVPEGSRYFVGEGTELDLLDLGGLAAQIDSGTAELDSSAVSSGFDFEMVGDASGATLLNLPHEGAPLGAHWSEHSSTIVPPSGTRSVLVRLGGRRIPAPFRPEPVFITVPKQSVCEGEVYVYDARDLEGRALERRALDGLRIDLSGTLLC